MTEIQNHIKTVLARMEEEQTQTLRKLEKEHLEACSKQAKLLSEIEKDLADKQLQDFSKIQAQIQTLQNQQISSNQSLQNLVEHYNTLATMFKSLHEELSQKK